MPRHAVFTFFAVIAVLFAGPGPAAHAQTKQPGGFDTGFDAEPDPDRLVKPSLHISHSPFSLDSEEQPLLALRLEVEDTWHVYWRNSGDTGAPPTWEFELPPGVTLGEPMWPTPTRYHPSPGTTDFIFEDELVILFPLEIADDAREAMSAAGAGELTIRAELDWLVCREECLAGAGSAQITAPFIGTGDPSPSQAERFERWLGRIPKAAEDAPELDASFRNNTLVITAPNAVELTWFHHAYDAYFEPKNSTVDAITEGEAIRVPYTPIPDGIEVVHGVVVVAYPLPNGDQDRRSYRLAVPVR